MTGCDDAMMVPSKAEMKYNVRICEKMNQNRVTEMSLRYGVTTTVAADASERALDGARERRSSGDSSSGSQPSSTASSSSLRGLGLGTDGRSIEFSNDSGCKKLPPVVSDFERASNSAASISPGSSSSFPRALRRLVGTATGTGPEELRGSASEAPVLAAELPERPGRPFVQEELISTQQPGAYKFVRRQVQKKNKVRLSWLIIGKEPVDPQGGCRDRRLFGELALAVVLATRPAVNPIGAKVGRLI